MVALPEPRPETPRQAERRQAIENVQRNLLGRQLMADELTPAGLAARQREGLETLKGVGVGLPAGLLGLPADLLALLFRDAPSLLNKLVTGEPLDIEERGQFAKAFDAFQKVAGAEAIGRAMGFGEDMDAESESGDAASRAGMNPFRQGMLAGEFLADPFLAFKGIGALLKAGSRTDTPATRSTDLAPVETEQQPVRFNTTGDISLSDLPRSEVTGLPVLRTEVTQRMATPEETAAFQRGEDPAAQSVRPTEVDRGDFADVMMQLEEEEADDLMAALVSNDRGYAADIAGELLSRRRGDDLGAAADPVNDAVLSDVRSQLADEAEMFVERFMGLDVAELTPETPVTVFRVGDIQPGEVQSFSLSRSIEGRQLPGQRIRERRGEERQPLVEYTVRAGDILAAPNATFRGGRGTEDEVEVLIDSANVTPNQTIEGEFTATPATAPEGDEANQLFDAASQARALDDVENTQQATPAQPRTPGPEVGIGRTRQADEAMGDLDPAVPEFTYDSLMSLPGYRRKPDRNSQNMVYTVDDTGEFGEKVDNFSPVLTNLHAQEEMKKIPEAGIRPSELDKRLLKGAMKAEYKDSPFQDELLRLADEGNNKIQSVTAIEKAEEFLPQVRSRMFRLKNHSEDFVNNKTPYRERGIPYIGDVDENGQITRVGAPSNYHPSLERVADDGALFVFSTNKPDSIAFNDGSSLDDIPSVMAGHDYGFAGPPGGKKIPGYFGWARTYIVTTPDEKRYLVVNEIQSNAIRDYDMGSGVEMPKEEGYRMKLEDEDGNVETIFVQNPDNKYQLPDIDGPEVKAIEDRAAAENKTIKDMQVVRKIQKVKTFDERLDAFFESPASQGASGDATSYGESGKVRIPYDAEAKKFEKVAEKLFPEEITKSNRFENELIDLDNKTEALFDATMVDSTRHPYIALSPRGRRLPEITTRSFLLQNKDDLATVLPLPGESDFFSGLSNTGGDFTAVDNYVLDYIENNRSFIEGMIESSLRSAGQPTTVQNVEKHIRQLKRGMTPAAREVADNNITPAEFKERVFREITTDEVYGRQGIAHAALTEVLGEIDPAVGKILKGEDESWLNLTKDESVPEFGTPTRDKIKEMVASFSPETKVKLSKAYADKLDELEQTYGGGILEETRIFLDLDDLLSDVHLESILAQSIGGLGHRHNRGVFDIMKFDKRRAEIMQSGDVLSDAEKSTLMDNARETAEAQGIDLEKVDAFNKVKQYTGSGNQTGFILPPPFKNQSDYFRYAVRSIIKTAKEEDDINGVVFFSGADMFKTHGGDAIGKDAYFNTYEKTVDKALKEFEDNGGTVRRNVNKRDENGNLVDPDPNNIFSTKDGPNVAGRPPVLFASDGEGLRIIDFDDSGNTKAATREIRRAKGGEVDLRPRKMIHSGIGALAREVM